MTLEPNNLNEQLSAFLDGELPAAEAADLERRLGSDHALRVELEELAKVKRLVRALPRAKAPASIRANIREHLERRSLLVHPDDRPHQSAWGRVVRIGALAAGLVIVAAVGVTVWRTVGGHGPGVANIDNGPKIASHDRLKDGLSSDEFDEPAPSAMNRLASGGEGSHGAGYAEDARRSVAELDKLGLGEAANPASQPMAVADAAALPARDFAGQGWANDAKDRGGYAYKAGGGDELQKQLSRRAIDGKDSDVVVLNWPVSDPRQREAVNKEIAAYLTSNGAVLASAASAVVSGHADLAAKQKKESFEQQAGQSVYRVSRELADKVIAKVQNESGGQAMVQPQRLAPPAGRPMQLAGEKQGPDVVESDLAERAGRGGQGGQGGGGGRAAAGKIAMASKPAGPAAPAEGVADQEDKGNKDQAQAGKIADESSPAAMPASRPPEPASPSKPIGLSVGGVAQSEKKDLHEPDRPAAPSPAELNQNSRETMARAIQPTPPAPLPGGAPPAPPAAAATPKVAEQPAAEVVPAKPVPAVAVAGPPLPENLPTAEEREQTPRIDNATPPPARARAGTPEVPAQPLSAGAAELPLARPEVVKSAPQSAEPPTPKPTVPGDGQMLAADKVAAARTTAGGGCATSGGAGPSAGPAADAPVAVNVGAAEKSGRGEVVTLGGGLTGGGGFSGGTVAKTLATTQPEEIASPSQAGGRNAHGQIAAAPPATQWDSQSKQLFELSGRRGGQSPPVAAELAGRQAAQPGPAFDSDYVNLVVNVYVTGPTPDGSRVNQQSPMEQELLSAPASRPAGR